jgi:hypothetical protein
MKTITAHITNLGKILNKTEDPKLKNLLETAITFLQRAHANPKIKNKSTPGNLINVQEYPIQDVVKYCSDLIPTGKPEWQVLAERNGWAPKI